MIHKPVNQMLNYGVFDNEKKDGILHLRYNILAWGGRHGALVIPAHNGECTGQMDIDLDQCFQVDKKTGKPIDIMKSRKVIKFILQAGDDNQLEAVATYLGKSPWGKEFKAKREAMK